MKRFVHNNNSIIQTNQTETDILCNIDNNSAAISMHKNLSVFCYFLVNLPTLTLYQKKVTRSLKILTKHATANSLHTPAYSMPLKELQKELRSGSCIGAAFRHQLELRLGINWSCITAVRSYNFRL